MTNSSPPEPQNPIPERRKRPPTGVTFDEMIAIIVAFSTIGTILFWSMGGKNSKLASNLGLGGGSQSNLLKSKGTTETGLGFGNILSRDTSADDVSLNQDLAAENRRLAAQLDQQETDLANVPLNQTDERSPAAGQRSLSLGSGARLAPLTGAAALSRLRGASGNRQRSANISSTVEPKSKQGVVDTEPEGATPGERETATQPEGTTPGERETATQPEGTTPGERETATQPEGTTPGERETATQPEGATPGERETATQPEGATPGERETAAQPEGVTPGERETAQTEPTAVAPKTSTMPEDVVPDYWAYPFVKQMRDKKLLPELAKNQEFEPDALITRASMATLVSQAFGTQPQTQRVKKFKDISNNNAIARDVDKAVRTGFMQGYSDDEFRPLQNIPRYQVLVTLATGLGLKPSTDATQILQKFGDSSKIPDWAKEQVAAATEAGLVVNPPDAGTNTLIPEKSATRGEVAAMIHQALVKTGKLQPLESEYIVKP